MLESTKTNKILTDMQGFTDPKNLEAIQDAAWKLRKELEQAQARIVTSTWKIGDTVQMKPEHRSTRPFGAKGEIKKINAVKMKVEFGGMTWNIPKTMLVKAE